MFIFLSAIVVVLALYRTLWEHNNKLTLLAWKSHGFALISKMAQKQENYHCEMLLWPICEIACKVLSLVIQYCQQIRDDKNSNTFNSPFICRTVFSLESSRSVIILFTWIHASDTSDRYKYMLCLKESKETWNSHQIPQLASNSTIVI